MVRTPAGFAQRCLESHIDEFLEAIGMTSASPVGTPGEKADAKTEGEEPLPAEAASQYRRAVIIVLLIGRLRPDIQYAVKECSRGMSCPTAGDLKRVKRIARYLRGSRNIEQHIVAEKAKEDMIEVYCDSDWAFDKIARKSTTGVVVKWSGGFVGTLSRTQGSVATSSTEAEG